SLGASVHTALKNWFALPVGRREPTAAATLLKATWVREGYRDVEQERAAYAAALHWLESYLATLDPADEPLGVERVVAAKTAVLAFNGRADRIDARHGDDGPEAVIVDYKTGRTQLDADDARGSAALALYAYAAQRVFRRPARRVELHHLPSGTVAAHEHTEQSLARQLARAEDTARDIMAAEKAVAAGADPDAVFPTRAGTLCGWCDFRRTCPAGADAPAREPWEAVERTLA
ncbi:MAG TPA: PD-(D/E)XK nuclease family protein, partial [Actinoplanes sp.]|nr:PD-(D/E)XK nuclease family protein [Actinoplanes sp.]